MAPRPRLDGRGNAIRSIRFRKKVPGSEPPRNQREGYHAVHEIICCAFSATTKKDVLFDCRKNSNHAETPWISQKIWNQTADSQGSGKPTAGPGHFFDQNPKTSNQLQHESLSTPRHHSNAIQASGPRNESRTVEGNFLDIPNSHCHRRSRFQKARTNPKNRTATRERKGK